MSRDMFLAVELPKDDSAATQSCRANAGGIAVADSRAMAKAKTMSSRQFQRTDSPKPSKTGGAQGLDIASLVAQLSGADVAQAREAACAVRNALKSSPVEAKNRLQELGGIDGLVGLLKSSDQETVEVSIAALLSLSLSDGTETSITKNEGLESIVEVLKTGSPTAKETAAATIFALTSTPESKERVRQSGGIPALAGLLQAGSLRGKKDASLALFNLALDERCASEMVSESVPGVLFRLLATEAEPGLDDKVVAVIANLARFADGRQAVYDVEGSVDSLVDIIGGGSTRSKEDAVVALFQLATYIPDSAHRISEEGAMQALSKLGQTGTPRARAKAKALLELLRTNPSLQNSTS